MLSVSCCFSFTFQTCIFKCEIELFDNSRNLKPTRPLKISFRKVLSVIEILTNPTAKNKNPTKQIEFYLSKQKQNLVIVMKENYISNNKL